MTRSAISAAPTNMPLLCGLGRHKVVGMPRWNDGFYFATCQRCGRDLVRTAFEKWTVPDGFRVVWRPDSPQRKPTVRLVAAADAYEESGSGQVEFPIREEGPDRVGRTEPTDPLSFEEDLDEERESEPVFMFSSDAGRAEEAVDAEPSDATEVPLPELLRTLWKGESEQAPDDADAAPAEADDNPRPDDTPVEEPEASPPEEAPMEEPEAARFEEAPLEEPETVLPEEPETVLPEEPAEPEPRPHYFVIPDFMDERPVGLPYDPTTGEIRPELLRADGPDEGGGDDPRSVLSPGWRNLVREKAQSAGVAGSRLLGRVRLERRPQAIRVGRATGSAGIGEFVARQAPVLAAAVFGGLVVLAAVVDGRNRPAPSLDKPVAEASQPRGAAVRLPAAGTKTSAAVGAQRNDLAFVTASLLNCRAIPDDNGEIVRRIARGDSVQVLGADPGWLSVSHQGRQCWASARLISTERPL